MMRHSDSRAVLGRALGPPPDDVVVSVPAVTDGHGGDWGIQKFPSCPSTGHESIVLFFLASKLVSVACSFVPLTVAWMYCAPWSDACLMVLY